ncbi:hypothetical protein ACFVYV_10090 [Streptomyces mirabilis]|uniref:hypothetical protein n=1 Tax=Streptomyces mirabilis TaxID=68239 RepID=UPI0036D8D619
MPRFTDKTVTGAAGALGAGMVRRFASEDARVVVGARRREQALADRDADLRPRAVTYGRSLGREPLYQELHCFVQPITNRSLPHHQVERGSLRTTSGWSRTSSIGSSEPTAYSSTSSPST